MRALSVLLQEMDELSNLNRTTKGVPAQSSHVTFSLWAQIVHGPMPQRKSESVSPSFPSKERQAMMGDMDSRCATEDAARALYFNE